MRRRFFFLCLIGALLSACQHVGANRNPLVPAQETLANLSPEQQWCLRAFYLMGSYGVAEQARIAIEEMARNRGCFNAPPAHAVIENKSETIAQSKLPKRNSVYHDQSSTLVTKAFKECLQSKAQNLSNSPSDILGNVMVLLYSDCAAQEKAWQNQCVAGGDSVSECTGHAAALAQNYLEHLHI